MAKTEQYSDSVSFKSLENEFSQGMAEKPEIAAQDHQAIERENSDLCLPPLLVKTFQSGLEEELKKYNCGCGEERDCSHHADSSGDHGCGGCHHHD